ncbi:hypothetical protein NN561_017011 [Cricetulus griseus]
MRPAFLITSRPGAKIDARAPPGARPAARTPDGRRSSQPKDENPAKSSLLDSGFPLTFGLALPGSGPITPSHCSNPKSRGQRQIVMQEWTSTLSRCSGWCVHGGDCLGVEWKQMSPNRKGGLKRR